MRNLVNFNSFFIVNKVESWSDFGIIELDYNMVRRLWMDELGEVDLKLKIKLKFIVF